MNDTIAAISTGLSESGIGIIRISGDESFEIADSVLRTGGGGHVAMGESHRVHHAFVTGVSRETLDEVLVVNMRGPRTYTGEDTVEINCHGGVLMMKRVLDRVLTAGARLAEPGEFTKRAFLNGRMDLSEAEAVADIISARSDAAIRASVRQLRGSVSRAVRELRAGILADSAYIEAALDDPEHYELKDFPGELYAHTEGYLGRLEKLLSSYERGRFIREGINTAIIGRPNAGKSSLLNALLGEERAIVTDIPGTTRDTISESLTAGNISLNLIDTAGIRESLDPIEKIGLTRTRQSILEADLILWVIDGAESLSAEDREAAVLIDQSGARTIIVLNKNDLGIRVKPEEAKALIGDRDAAAIEISATGGQGIDSLTDLIEKMFYEGSIRADEEAVITSLRHAALLNEAKDALLRVLESVDRGLPEDFYTIDLMDAYRALGEIIGEETGEDLINEIFSRFCMGK